MCENKRTENELPPLAYIVLHFPFFISYGNYRAPKIRLNNRDIYYWKYITLNHKPLLSDNMKAMPLHWGNWKWLCSWVAGFLTGVARSLCRSISELRGRTGWGNHPKHTFNFKISTKEQNRSAAGSSGSQVAGTQPSSLGGQSHISRDRTDLKLLNPTFGSYCNYLWVPHITSIFICWHCREMKCLASYSGTELY